MSAVPGLSHIGLRSSDLSRTENFYQTILEGTVLRRRETPDRRVWMEVRGLRIEIAEVREWPSFTELQLSVLPAISFLVSPDEVDAIVERMQKEGVPHREPMLKATGTGVGVYFGDPDGNPLSLSCPEGYERPGLARAVQNTWTPSPFDWDPNTRQAALGQRQ